MGDATVNYYNEHNSLKISLNAQAFSAFKDDDDWASTIAHEILHNLGWGHPPGSYGRSRAIVNYDECVRNSTAKLNESKDGDFMIR